MITKILESLGLRKSTFANPQRWLKDALGVEDTAAGVDVTVDNALAVSSVAACCRLLAESIASLPLHVYRRTGRDKERAADHRAYGLLHDQPNELQTSYTWRATEMLRTLLRGNSYTWIQRDESGAPMALWPLQPECVAVKVDAGRLIYEYRHRGEKRVYEHPDVIHWRGPSLDGITGMSIMNMARQGIGLAIAQDRHGASTFKNGARPGLLLKSPQVLSKDARERMKEFTKQFEGAMNAGRSMLLEAGMDVSTVGFSAEDAQFLQSRQFSVQEIARWFRVPPHMIGDPTRLAYASAEVELLAFITHTLRPWLTNFESELNAKLFPSSTKFFAEFDANGIARGDQASRYDAYSKGLAAGFLTVADVRQFENLPHIAGTDQLLRPANMLPVAADGGAAQ